METKTYSIYCIRNKTDGKRYIGLAGNPERRMENHHKRRAKSYIGYAIRKHGWENFTKEILEAGLTLQQAKIRECFWIKKFNSIQPNGYNLNEGGSGNNPSAEVRARMRKNHKGMKGKKHSAESCVRMSKMSKGKNLGRKHTIETLTKMSKSHKGNQRNLGKKRTAEQNAEMSKAIKKAYENPEYCKKIIKTKLKAAAEKKGLTVKQYAEQKLPILEKQLGTTKSEQLLQNLPITIKNLKAILTDN